MAQSLIQIDVMTGLRFRARWSAGRILLTLGLLAMFAWVVAGFDLGARLAGAAQGLWSRPELAAIFLASYTAAFYLRALAWRLLLPAGPAVGRLFAILQVALLANHVFPTKAGEVIRAALLARRGVPLVVAASATFLARLLDFGALCLIAVVAGVLAGGQPGTLLGLLALPVAGIATGVLGCFLLASGRLTPFYTRLPARLTVAAQKAQAALGGASPLRLLVAFAVAVPSWLLEAGALWSTAQAADVPLSWGVAIAATAFTIAFQAFQVTPGGIGLYEASLTGALALYGIDPATGLALAVATHALKFAYSYLAGFPFLIAEGVGPLGLGSPTEGSSHRPAPGRGQLFRAHARRVVAILSRNGATLKNLVFGRFAFWGAFAIAALSYLAAQGDAWTSPAFWLGLPAGLLAAAPLALLGRCHHLPPRLRPLLLVVPALFLAVFGAVAPAAALAALAIAAAVAMRRRRFDPPLILWPALLTQSIAAGFGQAPAVFTFGLVVCAALLLTRQWWLAHRPLSPPGPPPTGGVVAVLIPVHNEAATIASVVAGVPRSILGTLGFETRVVVVDDGSSDGSGAMASAAGADVVITHPTRRGLGAALCMALAAANRTGAVAAVYLDGDGEYDPADIPAVAQPVLRGTADYVLGSRFPSGAQRMRVSRRIGNQAFTALLLLLTGRRLQDGQTGFRAFSARALRQAEIVHDYNYAQVLTLDLLRKGMRLAQVPIGYRTRRHGRSFIRYHEYLRRVLPAIAREVLAP